MGETAAATQREVELTRKAMEDKVAKLTERAPEEARKLTKKLLYAALTAVAVILARKISAKAWEKLAGEPPPVKHA